jgi:hypothetical protein
MAGNQLSFLTSLFQLPDDRFGQGIIVGFEKRDQLSRNLLDRLHIFGAHNSLDFHDTLFNQSQTVGNFYQVLFFHFPAFLQWWTKYLNLAYLYSKANTPSWDMMKNNQYPKQRASAAHN